MKSCINAHSKDYVKKFASVIAGRSCLVMNATFIHSSFHWTPAVCPALANVRQSFCPVAHIPRERVGQTTHKQTTIVSSDWCYWEQEGARLGGVAALGRVWEADTWPAIYVSTPRGSILHLMFLSSNKSCHSIYTQMHCGKIWQDAAGV